MRLTFFFLFLFLVCVPIRHGSRWSCCCCGVSGRQTDAQDDDDNIACRRSSRKHRQHDAIRGLEEQLAAAKQNLSAEETKLHSMLESGLFTVI